MDFEVKNGELDAFRTVDFNWTRQLRSIWRDQPYHVANIHQDVLDELISYFLDNTRLPDPDNEPLGRVIVGPAGFGKTHLIGELRRRVWEEGGIFILLDLVGVTDFWSSVALGFLNSLQIRVDDERRQHHRLIHKLASSLNLHSRLTDIAARFRGKPRQLMSEVAGAFMAALGQRDRAMVQQHGDVIRAIVYLISEDLDSGNIAYAWLQGLEIDPVELRALGFLTVRKQPIDIVRGISWLLSLVGPTLIAVDQVDAIITEAYSRRPLPSHEGEAEQREAQTILDALVGGLMGLHEVKRRAVTVISSLEVSWKIIQEKSTISVEARYRPPTALKPLSRSIAMRELINARLRPAFAACNFAPEFETWPFAPEAFETASGFTPRQLLRTCDEHKQQCIAAGHVSICTTFAKTIEPPKGPPTDHLDATFAETKQTATFVEFVGAEGEQKFTQLFEEVLDLYARQLELPHNIDVISQPDPDQRRPSLHGRLTFTFRDEGDREQHYCFRILPHENAIAFQSRLRAAMTASGVDRKLKFRQLFILRENAPPSGAKTQKLVDIFQNAGGKFVAPTEEDLRIFVALSGMAKSNPDGFDAWLRRRKPLFRAALFKAAGLAPPSFLPSTTPQAPNGPGRQPNGPMPERQGQKAIDYEATSVSPPRGASESGASTGKQQQKATTVALAAGTADIPLGHRYDHGATGAPVSLSAGLLPRHVAILAGSGSGKTVLLRRLVEEAALLGIPAIVLDTNNDLARLADQWPSPPEGWTPDDAEKAARYNEQVEVVIWTPGRNAGRPMSLALLPDFAGLQDNDDERHQAIEMARATLSPFIGAKGAKAQLKEGVLADALRSFAREGGGDLDRLIDCLVELPDDVSRIDDAPKLAADMANQLRAAIATNPLLQSRGVALDPAVLFGINSSKTRISVINFSGLASDEARQSFVNQLQMSLFTWIKRHPSPTGRLFVLDEAQNFAPSQKVTPCKASTLALAAQARKYGLGMIFATQTPTGIDNKIVSNCTTHFYGRMSSPATIAAARNLLEAKGGGGSDDIARLSRGEFYFSTEGTSRPMRIRTPICLTWHPANPLTAEEVVEKSRQPDR